MSANAALIDGLSRTRFLAHHAPPVLGRANPVELRWPEKPVHLGAGKKGKKGSKSKKPDKMGIR